MQETRTSKFKLTAISTKNFILRHTYDVADATDADRLRYGPAA